jgi:signal transduction histidine kinase/phage shock protein PspC (stress-responsive transcriptional regulator)
MAYTQAPSDEDIGTEHPPGPTPDAALGDDSPDAAPPLRRRPDEGLLGGVCAGLARRLQVNVRVVRLMSATTVGFGGIGVALYALAWALVPVAPESLGGVRRRGAWREAAMMVIAMVALLFALRSLGLGLGQTVVWPLVVGGCGLALVWRPALGSGSESEPGSASLRARLRRSLNVDAPRVVLGALMVAFASASLLHHFEVMHSLGRALGAVAIIATIVFALVVPWFVRLGRSLSFERAGRIRERERAEVAAHLHDSVLQTLALIQKRAADPREVAGLARRQERELRSWLGERPTAEGGDSIAAALERAAADVEERHRVPIEVVTVGDGPMEARLEALVGAAREAMTNAAKFAGAERVDLYAEVDHGRAEVFIRDRGVGFDTEGIPADRRGVRDSIVGRMERHQGRASVTSRPGAGTEVELIMEGVGVA